MQHRPASPPFGGEKQCLRRHHGRPRPGSGRGQREPSECRIVSDCIWCVAARNLPKQLTSVQIERRDAVVRRLEEGQTAHVGHATHTTHVAHVRARRIAIESKVRGVRKRTDVQCPRLRIERPVFPVGAADAARNRERSLRTIGRVHERWRRVELAEPVRLDRLDRRGTKGGREVDQVVGRDALQVERRRFGGIGLRG